MYYKKLSNAMAGRQPWLGDITPTGHRLASDLIAAEERLIKSDDEVILRRQMPGQGGSERNHYQTDVWFTAQFNGQWTISVLSAEKRIERTEVRDGTFSHLRDTYRPNQTTKHLYTEKVEGDELVEFSRTVEMPSIEDFDQEKTEAVEALFWSMVQAICEAEYALRDGISSILMEVMEKATTCPRRSRADSFLWALGEEYGYDVAPAPPERGSQKLGPMAEALAGWKR